MRSIVISSNEFAGFIAIDKPAGISSFDVIRRLRKLTGIRKIGHCGTLDPFATGLLVCCIGSFTRLAKFIEQDTKTYSATIKLGEATATGDTEAEVSEYAIVPKPKLSASQLESLALELTELPIPAYSAIKINGKRAYSLARAGLQLDMPCRSVAVTNFKVMAQDSYGLYDDNHLLRYICTVTKGTYIRSLSEWIAQALGTVGHTVSLRREAIRDISIHEAVELDTLTSDNWKEYILPPHKALSAYPAHILDDPDIMKIKHGMDLIIPELAWLDQREIVLFDSTKEPIAIGLVTESLVHPCIVLI